MPLGTASFLTRRRAGRIRRLATATVVVVALAASYFYVFLALLDVPDGNPFREWPLYVFCVSALVVAAVGVVADRIRLTRGPRAPIGETSIEAGSQVLVGEDAVEARPPRPSADT